MQDTGMHLGFCDEHAAECKKSHTNELFKTRDLFQYNETSMLSRVKQITSPGWMHEMGAQGWCTGKTQRDGMEREAGGGDRDGEHM